MSAKSCLLTLVTTFFLGFVVFSQPVINSFSPTSGPVGTSVTINGANFSATAANNVVYLGGVKATVIAATTTSLTAVVPAGAVQQTISVTANNLTASSAQPFFTTYSGGGSLAGRSFEQGTSIPTSLYPYGLAVGDFDNDGKPDVATVNNANVPASYLSVHRNAGSNGIISFASQINLNIGDNGFGVTAADFDGDGKLDLAATYIASSGNVSIYKNNSTSGNISFAPALTYAAGNSPYTIAAGDIDGDGKPDLVICNYTGNTVSILRNTSTSGSISFAQKIIVTTALAPYDLALGDLDGDGKLDVVTSNSLSNNVSALRNTSTAGNISFAAKVDYSAGSSPRGIVIGDLDGDFKPEIAFVNNADNTVSILRNTCSVGAFSFASRTNFSIPNFSSSNSGRIVISDLDGDSKADLIVSSDYVYLFKNNCFPGTVSFASALPYVSSSPYRICITDLDVDGKPDIAVTNVSYQSFSVFRNRVPLPQITSLSPPTAGSGAAVIINGYNFSGATEVRIGGVPATNYTVNNANSITAIVGAGASGYVNVTTPYGTDSFPSFVFAGPPVISSASPMSAATGDTIFLSGQNFNGATAVSFGGATASYFTVVSPGLIKAVVGSGASGTIAITTAYGTGSINGFFYLPIPVVNSFSPTSAATGNSVVITGRNFTGITSVTFGGVSASSFTVVSPTQINAIVGNGASGNVSVTNGYGTGTLIGFTYIPPPVISSFTPTSAGPGMTVTINGTNFSGATNVSFGGMNASSFTIVSPTKITAVVSYGTSGAVSVTNGGGTGSLNGFTFVPSPTITSFTPKLTGAGGTVTITGTNFSTTTSVTIGSAAASFTVVNSTTISAVVSSGATSGSIRVTTLGGIANASDGISFTGYPVVNSFSPRSGSVGTTVTISGANFNPSAASNVVYFGGVKAVVSSATQNQLVVTVPTGAHYGPITVTTNNQIAYSLLPFAVTFSGGGSFNASSFAGRVDFVAGGKPASIAAGDLDGDGKPDVVVANTYSNSVSFFRNTSNAGVLSFATKIDSNAVLNPHAVKLADIDGDGKLDVIFLTSYSYGNGTPEQNAITIFKNKSTVGSLSFEAKLVINTNQCPGDLAVTDLNMDGKLDLAVTYYCYGGPQQLWVYRNITTAGNISFFQPQVFTTSGDAASDSFMEDAVSVADVNNDGKPDLIVGFGNGTFFSVLYNQTNVASPSIYMQYQCYSGSSCWIGPGYGFATSADFNSDDKVDVLTSDYVVSNSSISFGSFNHRRVFGIGGNLAVDGLSGGIKPDFARVNPTTNTVSAVRNISIADTVKFAGDVDYGAGTNPNGVVTADFNGDGKVDIAVTNKDFNTFSVLLNNVSNVGPLITSFSPRSGSPGVVITITGNNFINVTAVTVGGVPVTTFTVVNSTTITAIVDNGVSGNVAVTTATGTAALAWFYYAPTISSFSPTNTGTGLAVTITGNNFTGATAVSFGGIAASSYAVISPTQIEAIVGNGASGNITVTTPGGTATASGFTYVPAPTITSFNPTSGTVGTLVTITGTNLSNASSVRFGATNAVSFTVVSPSTITATVGNGSSGNIFITTPGGTTYSVNQIFAFIAPPTITSFTPASGIQGSTITITGTNFTGATAVSFGGIAAASFTVVSPTSITAVVANGASGSVMVTTPSGSAVLSGFSFTVATALPGVSTSGDELMVFPNPAENVIMIRYPAAVRGATIQLIDEYGRLVKERETQRNSTSIYLNIQALSAGIYKILWSDGRKACTVKFLKK